MFLGLLDPEPLIRGTDPTRIPMLLLSTLYDFLSLKNNVNVALKCNTQKNFLNCHLEGYKNSRIRTRIRIRYQRYGSADPDLYQYFADPQHCKTLLLARLQRFFIVVCKTAGGKEEDGGTAARHQEFRRGARAR
jgi:hypothetical protein